MNYIKKKIKGKKNVSATDDDDLDPDVFHVHQAPEGAPKDWVPYDERIDHDSEEWQAFKQLTQRVTNIVEESKQNLTKIVATTTLDENTRTIKEVNTTKPKLPEVNFKKKSAPPRPVPPTRPPPPPTTPTPAIVNICPTDNFHEDKRFESFGSFDDSFEQFAFSRNATSGSAQTANLQLDFGFKPVVTADLPLPELVLDVDNLGLGLDIAPGDPDPFDTSFVDKVQDGMRNEDLFELEPEVQNLNILLEETLEKFGIVDDDDPFVIKEDVLAAVEKEPEPLPPLHLILQTEALPLATNEPLTAEPDLFELAGSAYPVPVDASPLTASGCNPFAISGCNSMSELSCDLFDLGGTPLDTALGSGSVVDPPHLPEQPPGSDDVVSETVSDRRASNPFCQSPINETIAGRRPIDAELFVATSSSSFNTQSLFDPFDTTQLPHPTSAQRQLSAELLTPQNDFPPSLDFDAGVSGQSPVENRDEGQLTVSSEKRQPPIRPPIPEFIKESERVWDCFDTSEENRDESQPPVSSEKRQPPIRPPIPEFIKESERVWDCFDTSEENRDEGQLPGSSEKRQPPIRPPIPEFIKESERVWDCFDTSESNTKLNYNFDCHQPEICGAISPEGLARENVPSSQKISASTVNYGVREPILENSELFDTFHETDAQVPNNFDDMEGFTSNRFQHFFNNKERVVVHNAHDNEKSALEISDPFDKFNETEERISHFNDLESDPFSSFTETRLQNVPGSKDPALNNVYDIKKSVLENSDPFTKFNETEERVSNIFDDRDSDPFSSFTENRLQHLYGKKEPDVNNAFSSNKQVLNDEDSFVTFNDTKEPITKNVEDMKSDLFCNFNEIRVENQVSETKKSEVYNASETHKTVLRDSDPFHGFNVYEELVPSNCQDLNADSFSNFNEKRIKNKISGAEEPVVNNSFNWSMDSDPFNEPVVIPTFGTVQLDSCNRKTFTTTFDSNERDPFQTFEEPISNDNFEGEDSDPFAAINKDFGTKKTVANDVLSSDKLDQNKEKKMVCSKDLNSEPDIGTAESDPFNTFTDSSQQFINNVFDGDDPFATDAFSAKEAVLKSTFDSPESNPFNAFDHRQTVPINVFSDQESFQNSKFSVDSCSLDEPVLDLASAEAIVSSSFEIEKPIESSSFGKEQVLDDPFLISETVLNAVSKPNKFDILNEEDKVDFEPISVHLNITSPSPKSKAVGFFEENFDIVTEKLPSTDPNDQQVSYDDEDLVKNEPNSFSLEDNFGFDDNAENDARIFGTDSEEPKPTVIDTSAFEDFEAKFSSIISGQPQTELEPSASNYDPFSDFSAEFESEEAQGFGPSDDFDHFFGPIQLAPQPSPAHLDLSHTLQPTIASQAAPSFDKDTPDSDDSGPDFSVFIRPKMRDECQSNSDYQSMPVPMLAPPPAKSPTSQPRSPSVFQPYNKTTPVSNHINLDDEIDEFLGLATPKPVAQPDASQKMEKVSNFSVSGSQSKDELESLGSPVFEADDSVPLEDVFPPYDGHGWEMVLRTPNKKKLTGQRSWKKIYIVLKPNGVLHLFAKKDDKDPFQELPLQGCYSLSEIATQQYDQYGKIFTLKLQYVFYKERVGVRPGQISKVTHGQITSLSKLAKLGLPLEHAPQVSQLLKLGSQNYAELKEFVRVIEDALFHLLVHRDRAVIYKTEEIQVTVVDELRAEVADTGAVMQQVARVRVFFLAFIADMPDVDIGLNDITKQGKEIVSRHDIIPVVTEEWIRLEKCEFHACVVKETFEKNRTLRVHPPDACFFELMRFRIRPPKNRELPLQVRPKMIILGNRIEIRAEVIVPGSISRKHGQIPCEDVAIRFPIPECWIYLFRTEKHFRYGSVKSTNRRAGKLKGLDRFMGTGSTLDHSLIEVSTGQAKYEHHHRAIVWRVPKLPKDGQGAYSTYLFVCRMELGSHDQLPEQLESTVHVEFYMPTTTVSHTTVRSISVTNPSPPEKYVKYLAYHSYRVGIEHVTSTSENEYVAVTSGVKNGNGSSNARSDPSIDEENGEEEEDSFKLNK